MDFDRLFLGWLVVFIMKECLYTRTGTKTEGRQRTRIKEKRKEGEQQGERRERGMEGGEGDRKGAWEWMNEYEWIME